MVNGAYDEILGIKVTNKAVKCLGFYIGHDKEECYNKNWMKIYHDMEKLFEKKKINSVWKNMRNQYTGYFQTEIYCYNTMFAHRGIC